MSDMVLKVQCPNNSEECSVVGGEIMESMLLLGDNEQTMQCLSCGFGSSNKMKSDNYQPNEFKDICKQVKNRWWAPSTFTTENYNVIPVEDEKLKWKIIPNSDKTTEVIVPSFADAFKMVEKMENLIGEQIQQSEDN
tara:strand:+ start:2837 stop:3247 length:411 start_codon:yes stop_codon:yes gene_type:complete